MITWTCEGIIWHGRRRRGRLRAMGGGEANSVGKYG